jgi:hypothetical protein
MFVQAMIVDSKRQLNTLLLLNSEWQSLANLLSKGMQVRKKLRA